MDAVRRPLVIASAIVGIVAFALELGSRLWIAGAVGLPESAPRPGLGIPSLAAVDSVLVLTLLLNAASAVGLDPGILARLNGIVTAIVAILTLLASIALVFVTFALLMLMVGLLLAAPFGTAVYMAVYGHFDRGEASVTLGVLMALKVAAAILIVLGGQQVLKSKNNILLFASSIGLTLLLTFLHGLPPRFLVSITDAVGALIALIVAIVWAIAYLIGGINALIGAFQLNRRKPEER